MMVRETAKRILDLALTIPGLVVLSPALGALAVVVKADSPGPVLSVKPGITGLWQVSGRSEVTGEARARLDLEYVRTRSLWLDVKLLVQTIPAVFGGRGAR